MNRAHFFSVVKRVFAVTFLFLLPLREAISNNQSAVNTLVIVFHPYPERSVLTKGLQEAAARVEGVTVRNLETVYGFDTRNINGEEERRIMREYSRVVFIFPTHWFNITPMMKAWLNDTWGSVGPGVWQGKEMLIVSTVAGGSSTYGETGKTGVTLADVFLPMKASALHASMTYLTPLVLGGDSLSTLTSGDATRGDNGEQ